MYFGYATSFYVSMIRKNIDEYTDDLKKWTVNGDRDPDGNPKNVESNHPVDEGFGGSAIAKESVNGIMDPRGDECSF